MSVEKAKYNTKKSIIKKTIYHILARENKLSRYLLRLKRNYKLRAFQSSHEKILEISGGETPLNIKHVNVDIIDDPYVDVVANLNDPLPFADDSIDRIISIATLEHFNILNLRRVLSEFHRILKPGGRIEIGVPSLAKIFEYYSAHGCDNNVIRYLHGAQKDEYDLHLCILDKERFEEELTGLGYADINEVEYDYPFHSKAFMMRINAKKS
jgi:SAM-dependent methyltransferase